MKYCKKCKIKISDNSKICPLCQHALVGEDNSHSEIFPYIPLTQSKWTIYIKLIILSTIAANIISIIINATISNRLDWSLYVVGGTITLWIIAGISLPKLKIIPKIILHQAIICTILALIWDIATGWHSWSIIYVIPFLCAGTNIALIAFFFVLKPKIDDVAFYYFMNLVYGFLPFWFIFANKVNIIYPSLISIGVSTISLAAFILFYWANILEMLKSKFHI